MAYCKSCGKHFDMDDFMEDNVDYSDVCPDCYYGGDMCEGEIFENDDLIDDDDVIIEDFNDAEDARTIEEFLGNDMEYDDIDDEFGDIESDYEDCIEAEEGEYE